ncbi:MAG: tRNA pseudouridine(55) synthase TruB [Actinomycetota bacterium]|jgi:tRNA pseudouridine55 synthase|nr:tRNA pseudouridine(55) synthase TruB [Ilumatobacteraceae bacterium]
MPRKPATVHGFVVVDKPVGITSHDVVARLRRRFSERRVGHSGTLDPDATGVLIVALGNATRLLQFLGDLPKTYTGEVVFGTATSTLDASGEVTATRDMSTLTIDRIREASKAFLGDIAQIPPMVSAIKVGGRRLHEIAREGGEVHREPRHVTIHRYVVGDVVDRVDGNPVVNIEVTCSSGTYIRTLAADLGEALGGVAHLRNLRRRAIGDFVVGANHDSASIDTAPLQPAVAVMAHLDGVNVAMVSVDADSAVKVRNGRSFDALGALDGREGERRIVLNERNELIAVYSRASDAWRAEVVMPEPLA